MPLKPLSNDDSQVKRRLLLVEDDPGIRWSLVNALGALFEITETDSAAEAIKLIESRHDIQVIVTDVSLIEGNDPSGLTVAYKARKKLPAAKIVVMSGQELSEMAEALLQEVAATFLPKPFQIQELLVALNE